MKHIALLLCLWILPVHAALAAEEREPEAVVIGGKKYLPIPDELMRSWGFSIPDLPREKNAAWVYFSASNAYSQPEFGSGMLALRDAVLDEGWTKDSAPLDEYLDDNARALALIKQAAAMDECYFPPVRLERTRIEDVFPADFRLPHLSKMREFARFLIVKGKKLEFDGRPAEALEVYLLVPRVSYHASRGVNLIDGLVGLACNRMATQAIGECIVRHELDDATLADVQARLSKLSARRPDLVWSMENERICSRQTVEYLLRYPEMMVAGDLSERFWGRFVWRAAGRIGWRVFVRMSGLEPDEWRALMREDHREYWDIVEKCLRMPLVECLNSDVNEQLQRLVLARKGTGMINLMLLLGPAVTGPRVLYATGDLYWTVLDVEFALARYKATHGTYPRTLDELEPLMLSDGIDPFSGEALRYRLEDDGSFTIWSVGPNLVDDGGKVEHLEDRRKGDDYVWNSRLLRGSG
jgi:hypothetical protein